MQKFYGVTDSQHINIERSNGHKIALGFEYTDRPTDT